MTLPIGLQLYTVREAIAEKGLEPILEQVAAIGYAGVEPYGGLAVDAVAATCKRLGLRISSAHLGLPVGDAAQQQIERAQVLGITDFVIPYLDPEAHFRTEAQIKATCALLNQANAAVKAAGMRLVYHNHWFEYELVGDQPAYKLMLDWLDDDIAFELDAYWVAVGGQDPAAVLGELAPRTPLLHVKDGPATTVEAPMVAVGDGTLDYAAIIRAGDAHLTWLLVELDRCATDMLEAVAKSYRYLVTEGWGHGSQN